MINTILVPLDGSPLAERALPHAEAIATATGARIALIRAVQEQTFLAIEKPAARVTAMAEAEAYLTEIADRLIARGFTVDTGVVHDGAATAILAEAERREANLIAMATHGRGGFGRLRYGSVAEAVLRRTETPLLLVRAWSVERQAAPFAVRPRLLVPLDGTAFAEEALLVATRLALALGGELILLHAVSPFEQVFMPEAILANFPDEEAARGAEAREYLEQLVARGATGGCQTTIDVRLDVPTLAIEEAARDHTADLVVMATHGRTALGRLALGNVADAVLQYSRVPLLLVRPRRGTASGEHVEAPSATPDWAAVQD
jgi:nucleotide-binding universal stress UspA family protein